MDNNENTFKANLLAQKRLIGSWNMVGSTHASEAMGWVGFDFLVVDLEHAPYSIALLQDCLRAIASTPTEAVVRLPSQDPIIIKQVLDSGARNLMVPMIENTEQAEAVVGATRYPPDGYRGFALMHRASRYGTIDGFAKKANDNICIMAQLETPSAIENLGEISAVPGVDALFVGPGDLSAAVGEIGNPGHEKVQGLMMDAAQRSAKAGVPIGTVMGMPEAVRKCQDNGYQFAAVAGDLAFMMRGATAALKEVSA